MLCGAKCFAVRAHYTISENRGRESVQELDSLVFGHECPEMGQGGAFVMRRNGWHMECFQSWHRVAKPKLLAPGGKQ